MIPGTGETTVQVKTVRLEKNVLNLLGWVYGCFRWGAVVYTRADVLRTPRRHLALVCRSSTAEVK